ncbi:MAG: transglycosylase domain-containing protein, partial [Megasphaera elsdenii]|nr:transglycosylase domain-containing protein [Megasphaera elsdenii]
MYTPRRRAKKAKKAGPLRRIRLFIALCLVVFAGLGFGYIFAAYQSLPAVGNNMRPAVSSQVFDSHGRLITTLHSDQNRLPIDINKVPQNLQNAFIAAEDNRFYEHIGIDPIGIFRAIFANLTNRGIAQGGSTITQQLAKNAFLSQEQTLKRKIQEAMLALEIEHKYSKKEILEMYMNQIYFGQGAYGIQTAAKTYFNKDVNELSLTQCAMLAGLPKSPNYYSPFNNLNEAKKRKNVVLDQMVKYGYVSAAEAEDAKNQDLGLSKSHQAKEADEYASFIDYVSQQVAKKYGDDALYKEGLKIYTTMDVDK